MVRSTMMNRLVQRGSYPRLKMLLLAVLLPYALLTGRAKLHGLKNDASHRRLKESPEPFDGEEAVQRLLDKLVVRKLIKNMVEGRRELQKRGLQQTSPTEGNTTSGDANESRSAKELPNEPSAATEHGEQEQEEAVGIESSFWEICKLWFLGQCGFNIISWVMLDILQMTLLCFLLLFTWLERHHFF